MSTTIASDQSSRRGLTRLAALLREQVRQGLAPRELAMALALGATVGLLPTLWGTSLLCFVLAGVLRLNQPLVQLANYLVYPLQILLFIPYLRAGDLLFGLHGLPQDLGASLAQVQDQPLQLVAQLGWANLRAAAVWGLSAPLLMLLCFLLARGLVRFLPRQNPHAH